MKNARNNELSDRRGAAAEAKAALLNAYRDAKDKAEPTRLAKQAERQAVAAAREERRAERERVKREERAQAEAAEAERQAAAEAEARADAEAREAADKDRIARVIADEAARKAARDLRYANRKARKS
ncbi:UNVERIFIED_ORG: FKBP-type peptidyl-prolyl cis-trans isomerase [Rhizobium aethiopicum]|uniref:DUF6481 family protein n=1 Tax=unclassified Rhizobium TaxID=2613769 RepID=UPI0008D9324F|nr:MULTISPECIES: DUF6481 family protein [unclassified Rhizobium]OHV19451.1 hypothetical protein BBJ66_15765 [Rhizobium sp. RSm-3]RVU09799.1 hypothetical protein EOS93_17075 [Rhizobium sp. RMa-01]